jgi:AraC-like DNA-binding protein
MTELQRSEFLYAYQETVPADWHLQPHTHSHHELVVILAGSERSSFMGKTWVARPMEALFFPAGQTHEEWAVRDEDLSKLVLGFSWSGYRPGMPVHLPDADGRLRRLTRWLEQEGHATFRTARSFRNTLLRSVLAEYGRLSEASGWGSAQHTESPVVEAVQEFVQRRLADAFTLDDLAKHVGLSKYYLVRSYRSLTGLTPMDHARLIRLEAARNLLLTTTLPLKAIAPKVGFASEYHLSRLLRSRLGVGARELRRRSASPTSSAPPPAESGLPPHGAEGHLSLEELARRVAG